MYFLVSVLITAPAQKCLDYRCGILILSHGESAIAGAAPAASAVTGCGYLEVGRFGWSGANTGKRYQRLAESNNLDVAIAQ